MKPLAALSFVLVLASAGCSRHGGPALAEVTLDQVAGPLTRHEPIAIFDANGRERYLAGHVPGAHWVRFNQVQATDLPSDHAKPLVFYCANTF